MLVEQKFDDCENHGLQHAWKIFEIIVAHYSGGSISSSSVSGKIEVPVPEVPIPFLRNRTSHSRKCQNCMREEHFEVEEAGKWVRK
jgi:hypothetical protein